MAYSRYTRVPIFQNNDSDYRDVFFDPRGITETEQYATRPLFHPQPQAAAALAGDPRIWSATDKLYNISQQQYGSPQYWWVIAWFNQKASEADFKIGDIYYIPRPLETVLGYF
jgi:hypothetical protein